MAQSADGHEERTPEYWVEKYRREYPGPIRLRPAMYIGATDPWRVAPIALMNAVSAVAGQEDAEVAVTLSASGDELTVCDNRPAVQAGDPEAPWGQLVGALGAPLDFGRFRARQAPEQLSALCERLVVRVCQGGEAREQHHSQGMPLGAVTTEACADGPTVSLTFRPDPVIFTGGIVFDEARLVEWLREQAALRPGLRVRFHSERSGLDQWFHYPGGLRDYLAELNTGLTGRFPEPPFLCAGEASGIRVTVALQHTDRAGESILSFANNERTPFGGTHADGFRAGLALGLAAAAEALGLGPIPEGPLFGLHLRFAFYLNRGLTAVVSVSDFHPSQESATGASLICPEAEAAVSKVLGEAFRDFLAADPATVERAASRALKVWHARPWWLHRVPLEADGRADVRGPFLDAAFFVLWRWGTSPGALVLHTRFPRESARRCRRALDRADKLLDAAVEAVARHGADLFAVWQGDLAAQAPILRQLRRQCPGFRCSTYRRALHWVYYRDHVRYEARLQPESPLYGSGRAWRVLVNPQVTVAAIWHGLAVKRDRRNREPARGRAGS